MCIRDRMKIKGKSLRAASGKVEIASEDITTGDIDGLFDGDFVLALTNPHITSVSYTHLDMP